MNSNTTESAQGAFAYQILFRHQSQDISFPDWITLFTVCLAPLIAHLVAGAPKIVYLHNVKPPWHEVIVHYNPTSIIWRYFAITDRRIRARSWNAIDMAVVNALFWTPHGWDGSEKMAIECRDICIGPPPPFLERLFSRDSLKTVIVTMQGIQAVYLSSLGHSKHSGFALDSIFMPIAFLGLLRLPAAFWLTDEYLFRENGNTASPLESQLELRPKIDAAEPYTSDRPLLRMPTRNASYNYAPTRLFDGVKSLGGLAVRTFYTTFLLATLILVLSKNVPKLHQHNVVPLTVFLSGWMYVILLLAVIIPLVTYSCLRRSSVPSTVVPCASALWYKIFTCLLAALFVCLFIVSAMETRKTPCGTYTSISSSADKDICPNVVLVNGTNSS